jgi:hypothetical protein
VIPLLDLPDTLLLFIAVLALSAGSALLLARELFHTRAARALLGAVLAPPGIGFALWANGAEPWAGLGVRITWSALMVLAPSALALFISGLFVRGIAALRSLRPERPRPSPAPVPVLSRRAMMQASVSILPLSAASAGVGGLISAPNEVRVPRIEMRFRDLHPDLEGLKILHLSDLHLGVSKRVEHLEGVLARVEALAPDLVVVTGDLADNLDELRAALEVLHRRRPRLGVFASLGNHEYLHDIRRTRPIYEQSPVPLLVDRGTTLEVGRAKLYIAGADDPVVMGGRQVAERLDRSVERCSERAPADAFRLLLCHRPEGFAPAARRGFHLTLAGHTHGGQVGLFGRSAFQALWPDLYLWGTYARGGSRLYTTSGFGHWFPFRLGCPTEAPLIVLASDRSAG